MAPQKYSSVRYKSRPTALVPFRDDTSLIALRYDQTVQAEPPIPIPPPRSPLRNNRSTIAIAGAPVTRPSSTVSSSLSSNNIAAPSVRTPPQPNDTHPALRATTTPRTTASDLQRQSGRAASSKSPTVHEESEEEDPFTYKKFESIAIRAAPDPSVSSASDSTTFTIPKLRVKTGAHSPSQHSDCEITRSLNGANDRCSQCSIPLPSPGLSEDNNTASPTSPTTPPSAAECFPEKPASILSKSSIFRSPPSILLPSMKSKKLQKKAHPAQQVHQVDDHDMALDVETSLVGKDATAPVVRSASNRAPIPQWKSPAPVPAPVVDVPPPHLAHGAAKQPDTGVSSNLKTATIPRVEDDEFSQFITQMSFSKRGSIMLAGKKPDLVATLDAGANRDGAGDDALVSEQPSPPRMHPLGPSLMAKSQGDGTTFTAPRTPPTIPTIIAEEEPSPCSSPSDAGHEHERQQSIPSPPPAAIATPPAPAPAQVAAAISPEAKLPPTPTTPQSPPCIRVIPVDVERESQKVRSLYEPGAGLMWEEGGRHSALSARLEPTEEVPSDVDENDAPVESPSPGSSDPPHGSPTAQAPGIRESKVSTAWPLVDEVPKVYERAGGIEYWEDVNVEDVDRYGFIMKRRPDSRASTPADYERLGQYSPNRKRNILLRRGDMATHSAYLGSKRGPSRKMSARSLNTQASGLSTASRNSTRSALRQAANLLPHNKDRRWMDEAGDMLAPQLGLTSIGDEKSAGTIADESKYKEWGRTEKWRKMATVVKPGADGEGSFFEFDLKQPKLVDRTWKGIPDCWRSAAWWSFLSTSAKQSKERFASDDELFAIYKNLQEVPSPDDVQIDLDVPRTINQHIMFRRRYRGGQRLLFRVLHALSLYFPETGYVQGMAALGATLLSYYDEERCFVMLVRLWQVRGLNRLYSPGFVDLMDALRKFETNWLAGKDVASKLQELSIDPTAYATRWYLTLFNLSIPFPAQLRVWDVFMLLGEPSDAATPRSKPNTPEKGATHSDNSDCFDILHATSTAIIQALRDHLIDSEFENAMKALTSWVPIKNEDLLMKVIRAEYRQHHTKKKKT
ncbi:rab-GTPase-TBC domain-containing protein [Apiospora arundinis]|uniref:Rab-GTPase-TBC domain-containing protein n=1 Tax=Apiospora arundinis TaxID=335852 RepID=A0ABR2IFV1_9PEZI